jgi:predicted phage terminase large subunit-like protein
MPRNINPVDGDNALATRVKLWGSLLLFTQVFYKLRTGREFSVSQPICREPHVITLCRALTQTLRNEIPHLLINIPPRYGKTELLIHFVAWSLSRYPDSQFLYISYSHALAKKQTQTIRQILSLPHYKKLFATKISATSSAKDNFETTQGGCVFAAGSGGTITGRGAGLQNVDRFSGAVIIDDIHKPDEVTSDVMREGVIDWYYNTLQSRVNAPGKTPIIFIGQRLHEADLASHLIKTQGWETLILPALDSAGNALNPLMHNAKQLLKLQIERPYEFAAQYQQDPQPAGGGIFKPEWFYLLDEEPEFLATFITVDTAETDKTYNDATVFSFWGLYWINDHHVKTNQLGLHWIDCVELHIEPKDLETELRHFYTQASRHPVKPSVIAIEKKSTGVMLVSLLKSWRGIEIREIERTAKSGSKITRYLEIQPVIASQRVSLPRYGKHTQHCLEHCKKITANNTHRFDDIADTLYDAVKLGLIDQSILFQQQQHHKTNKVISELAQHFQHVNRLREERLW